MENSMFDKGFENRKKVLGAEHVERSWAAADDFNRPIQEFVTSIAGARCGAARACRTRPGACSTSPC